jgi:hypothetical protein
MFAGSEIDIKNCVKDKRETGQKIENEKRYEIRIFYLRHFCGAGGEWKIFSECHRALGNAKKNYI